jgi:DNA-binding NarL/FixJ family response regulator
MSAVTILIADDHELVRDGLTSILAASHPEWEVVAAVASGKEAIERGEALQPRIAIVDLSMPDIDGLQVATRLLEAVPGIRILILTMHAAGPIRYRLMKTGVSAYLAKHEAPGTLVNAMERILAGEPFFASERASRPIDQVEAPDYIPAQYLLTARELKVMQLLALGRTNKELAHELEMSVRTAESHHASILAKLRVDSIGGIVAIAVRDGLI